MASHGPEGGVSDVRSPELVEEPVVLDGAAATEVDTAAEPALPETGAGEADAGPAFRGETVGVTTVDHLVEREPVTEAEADVTEPAAEVSADVEAAELEPLAEADAEAEPATEAEPEADADAPLGDTTNVVELRGPVDGAAESTVSDRDGHEGLADEEEPVDEEPVDEEQVEPVDEEPADEESVDEEPQDEVVGEETTQPERRRGGKLALIATLGAAAIGYTGLWAVHGIKTGDWTFSPTELFSWMMGNGSKGTLTAIAPENIPDPATTPVPEPTVPGPEVTPPVESTLVYNEGDTLWKTFADAYGESNAMSKLSELGNTYAVNNPAMEFGFYTTEGGDQAAYIKGPNGFFTDNPGTIFRLLTGVKG